MNNGPGFRTFIKSSLDPKCRSISARSFRGQRQRIGIARALALKSKLIICDEPVSALTFGAGSSRQSFAGASDDLGLTYLFISHGLAVVEHISDRVAVMYLGKIVEICDAADLYELPLHPYHRPCFPPFRCPIPGTNANASFARRRADTDQPAIRLPVSYPVPAR